MCAEPALITTAHADGPGPEIVYVNPAFTRMTGYTREEVIGKTPGVLKGPRTDQTALHRMYADCRAGRNFHGEAVYYRKDGSEFYLEWNAGPVRNMRGEITHFVVTHRDLTARRRVEEELGKSEAEFRSLFELSAVGMARVSPEGKYLRVNDKYCRMLGYSESELLRLTLYDVTHPADREVSAVKLHSSFNNSDEYRMEKRYIRKDGAVIWALVNWTVVRDAQGKPLHSIASIQDIHARKLAEEALCASEQFNKAVLASLAANIAVLDNQGAIIGVNEAWNRFAVENNNAALAETAHVNYLEVCRRAEGDGADDARKALHGIQQVLGGGLADFQFEYPCHSSHEKRWFMMSVTPLAGGCGGAVVSHTNITERKQAEAEREELLAREQAARAEAEHAAETIRRLQAVMDSALGHAELDDWLPKAVERVQQLLETDASAILLLSENARSLVVRAATGNEAIGLQAPFGEGIAGFVAAVRAPLIVEDVRSFNVINPVLRENVRSLIAAPLVVEGRFVGVIHADSFQPRSFSESDLRLLQLAADRIALAIEQTRLYEIEKQARRHAEDSNRMKDEFLAIVSHELRSPLNAMMGYAQLLRFGPLDAQKVSRSVEVIKRSGKAQARLIDDLLDTARIISGKLRLEVEPVDLINVIEAAVQTICPAADAKGITIETDLNSRVGQITGDAERLQQVIWNLLSNAVKFTPSGGRVEIRLGRVDPHICITVSDTGQGIRPDFLPYIFDRFRQGDASSRRRYGGLGLGLSLVKYLVELHGGTVEVFSEGEGKGARFKVLLPVRAVSSSSLNESENTRVVTADQKKNWLAGVRALVVDDEDDARELIKTVIAQFGAEVVAASSAAEAFALFTTLPEPNRPNVVVTDLGMADEDGYELLRRLREWEYKHSLYTPAVALTAYGRSEDRMRALMAGFEMHVTKPVDPDELAVVIASVVSRREKV